MMEADILNVKGSKGKLINAAVNLLASRGFKGAIINDILEESKVSRSNFYYHFESKEELCLAALDKIGAIFIMTVVNQTLANILYSPEERLDSYFRYLIEVQETEACDLGCVFTNLATELGDTNPDFQKKITEIDAKVIRVLEHTYRDGMESGVFVKVSDPRQTAATILAACKGAVVLSASQKNPDTLRQIQAGINSLIRTSPRE